MKDKNEKLLIKAQIRTSLLKLLKLQDTEGWIDEDLDKWLMEKVVDMGELVEALAVHIGKEVIK